MIRMRGKQYVRATDQHPCSVCGRGSSGGCLVRIDGKKVVCVRTPSDTRMGEIGWLHDACVGPVALTPTNVRLAPHEVRKFLSTLRDNAVSREFLRQHARLLHVQYSALKDMGVKYSVEAAAIVFPMLDGYGRVVGCSFRRRDGGRWSLKGGRGGLFMSKKLHDSAKFTIVLEGSTDAAAAVGMRLPAVGRPSCNSGNRLLRQYLSPLPHRPVVVFADPNDCGKEGAIALANELPQPTIVVCSQYDFRSSQKGKKSAVCLGEIRDALLGRRSPWCILHANAAGINFDTRRVAELVDRIAKKHVRNAS